MSAFLDTWVTQTVVMVLWSCVCFMMGMAFCGTCYWYHIKITMKRADRKLRELEERRHGEDRRDTNG